MRVAVEKDGFKNSDKLGSGFMLIAAKSDCSISLSKSFRDRRFKNKHTKSY
ncbi:MAG: Unknown protein [uncultured Sulfurovum sp.]|uniref:Uncharacterized protein n=1 Tax=uncultured Sulfurovum sp. TaxID=269237 RepID=A0A6S6SWL8_9BACT|nr:MAG: Unknown protein [uncultured Sulfurovum sp.]